MNKQSKILITGGTGLIGSHLLRKLVSSGFENLHATHLPRDPFHLVQDIHSKVNWHEADITDSVALHDIFLEVKTVIHCAGMISFWPKEFKKMMRVNVDGTATIVNLCLEFKVDRLIHLSSIEALGKEEDDSIISETTEWKEDIDHTKYAVSKYLGELEAWRGLAEGLDVIIYNPALVLGAGYWDSGPMKLFKDVFNGLKYYPRGGMAMVDVRVLIKTIIDNLDNDKMYGNRFIVGSYNVKFKTLLDQIASHLKVDKPSKALTGLTATLAIRLEQLRSVFTNSKPLINNETYLVTDQVLNYSFDKINSFYKLDSKSFDTTLEDITSSFLEAQKAKKEYSTLPV